MMETLKLSLLQPFTTPTSLAYTQITNSSRSSLSIPRQLIRPIDTIRIRCTPNNSTTLSDTDSDPDPDPDLVRLNNPGSPWLMLPSVTDKTTGAKLERFYSLADGQTVTLNRKNVLQVPDTAKCIASTMGGWLGYVDTNEGKVYLSNPFLKDVLELPSLDTLPCVLGATRDPITNEIVHFKIRSYYYNSSWDPPELDPFFLVEPKDMVCHLSNLALSYANPRHCDTVVMALKGMDFRRLAYCHIGRQFSQGTEFDMVPSQFDPNCWMGLQEDYVEFPGLAYNQLVYDDRRRLFYAMFDELGILAFDVQRDRGRRSKMVFNFRKRDLVSNLNRAFEERYVGNSSALKQLRKNCENKYYLVTLENGDLLLIVRHYETLKRKSDNEGGFRAHKTLHFDVFRVVYDGYLERVTCLGNDRAVFIGWNQSFCIEAGSSPGVRPNCVYFTDDLSCTYNVHSGKQWGHDTGIFSLEDGRIASFYPYEDEYEEKKVAISVPLFWVAPLPADIWYLARERGIDDDKLSVLG